MLAAAASWQGLSTELQSAASSFGSLTSTLVGGPWQGAASAAMMTVATRHVQWLAGVAAKAQETSAQAMAAVSAFETAQVATVHPLAVAANRAQFVSLALSNLFGQNAPAIAAAESNYAQMWAQDVEAMLGYHAAASATASSLQSWGDDIVNFLSTYTNLGSGNTGGGFNIGVNNNGWFNIGANNTGWLNWGTGNNGFLNLLAMNAKGWGNLLSINANGYLNLLSLGNTGNFNITLFNPFAPEEAILAIVTFPEDPLSYIEALNIPSDLTGGIFGIAYPHPSFNNLPFTLGISGGNTGNFNFSGGNFGNSNAGHGNIGNYNKGSGDQGFANVGSGNIGDHNTYNGNIGSFNNASGNFGSYNTSNGNIGSHNSSGLRGILNRCTITPLWTHRTRIPCTNHLRADPLRSGHPECHTCHTRWHHIN